MALWREAFSAPGRYSYESVMGNGRVELVEDREEKRRGLACIFHQYAGARAFFVPE